MLRQLLGPEEGAEEHVARVRHSGRDPSFERLVEARAATQRAQREGEAARIAADSNAKRVADSVRAAEARAEERCAALAADDERRSRQRAEEAALDLQRDVLQGGTNFLD